MINPVADTASVTNATTNEDTQTFGGLVISRNAADGAEVTHFKITGITNGTLYKNDGLTQITNGTFITVAEGNAGLKFTPTANFFGSGSFTVQASTSDGDAGLGGSTVNATVTVNPVNDSPVAVNETYPVDKNAVLTVETANGVLKNDTDVDSDTLIAVLMRGPTSGSLALEFDGSFSYTPNADFEGADSFTYVAHDGLMESEIATVTIQVTSAGGEAEAEGAGEGGTLDSFEDLADRLFADEDDWLLG